METTQIADYIGKSDTAYVLAALLSKDTRQIVGKLLTLLSGEIGEGLYTMPPNALHITLCEIIQPKPYAQDKQRMCETHRVSYEAAPAEILKGVRPIKVHFNKLIVSPQAITIQGQDDGTFEVIRRQLVKQLPLPDETKLPPDIIHSSIARFTKELDLEKIREVVARHSIDCEEIVEEFKLVSNLALPLLRYQTIRTYLLDGPS